MTNEATQGSVDDARPRADESRSDRSLLRLYRHGDQEAATRLYERYAHRLRALAKLKKSPDLGRRVDADDIVQSVFGSFFRKAKAGVYDVPQGKELWRLFVVITLNKVRAKGVYHRAERRDVSKTANGLDRSVDLLATDGEACVALKLAIDEALDRLSLEKRTMIQLRMEGYEVNEISKAVNRSKRTVERLLQEGLRQLAPLLDE
jgi:RNA polymerase sigma-70 factor (ECF subfamily)